MDRSLQHAFEPEEVMAYLDGELEPQRAAALAAHLEHCAECQHVAKSIRQISKQMLGFEIEPAPQPITVAVLDGLQSGVEKIPTEALDRPSFLATARGFFLAHRYGSLAASLAVALALIAYVGSRSRQTQTVDFAREMESAGRAAPLPASSGHQLWFKSSANMSDQDREALAKRRAASSLASSLRTDNEFAFQLPQPPAPGSGSAPVVAPMIERNASLTIVAKNYDEASAAVEKLAKVRGGYVEKLEGKSQSGTSRTLSASLRVPANQLEVCLDDLRQLGHVEDESGSNDEVTAEFVDLQARLKVAQATEKRLIELLGSRTGRLEDVLDVERELARVRAEIESMQGQSALMLHQVSYATVQVELSEEFHEKLHSDSSVGTKLRNAFVGGLQNLQDGILGLLIFFLNYGLAILFWLAVILVPAWFARRIFLRRRAANNAPTFQRP